MVCVPNLCPTFYFQPNLHQVVSAKTGTDQETEVKVDTQGNGFSYQHIQQEDVLQRNMDINQQQTMMDQYRSMAQMPFTSNMYNG